MNKENSADIHFSLKMLIATSILFLISIFLGVISPKITGVATVIWVTNVIICINEVIKSSNLTLYDLSEEVDKGSKDGFDNKDKLKGTVYFLVKPIIGVAAIIMIVQIIALFVL